MSARRLGIHVDPAETYYEDGAIQPVRGASETFEGPRKVRRIPKGVKLVNPKPARAVQKSPLAHALSEEYGEVIFTPDEPQASEYADEMGFVAETIAVAKAAKDIKGVFSKKKPKAAPKAKPSKPVVVNVASPEGGAIDTKTLLIVGVVALGVVSLVMLSSRRTA